MDIIRKGRHKREQQRKVIFTAGQEILFQFTGKTEDLKIDKHNRCIRWLTEQDYSIFSHHLKLCGQKPLSKKIWNEIYRDGTIYCGMFENGNMIARACIEIISPNQWEIADVRVVEEYRNQGCAFQICQFVLSYILENNKTPTIRTKDTNYPMQKVIANLGFQKQNEI